VLEQVQEKRLGYTSRTKDLWPRVGHPSAACPERSNEVQLQGTAGGKAWIASPETDGSDIFQVDMPVATRDEFFHHLFHPSEMGLNVCRSCIDSFNHSASIYSFDDGEADPELKQVPIALKRERRPNFSWNAAKKNLPKRSQKMQGFRSSTPLTLFLFLILQLPFLHATGQMAGEKQALRNGGFESSNPTEAWEVIAPNGTNFSLTLDRAGAKEGSQSLLISASQPVEISLRQEVFLPVGTLWRLTGWVKSKPASDGSLPNPNIGIEAQAGDQGFSQAPALAGEWQFANILFRVPSPGRIGVVLNGLKKHAGSVWFDDIQLERVHESLDEESVAISLTRRNQRPIDLKQGGQFIELLCNLLPSMIAQQVDSTSFEEAPDWNQAYKRETDKPHRPWYPDGSVHVASYSLDTDHPFHGKRSQKIELPLATWAGISQDGFYLESGHSYRLRLHLRSSGSVRVRASLHGDGGMIAGPFSLGRASDEWKPAEVVLLAKRSAANATLTIEFEGPGTLWLDRVYLIDTNAVLGLWRPDVVKALKAMHPGIVRFGGSTIESLEWETTVGNWDRRPPLADDPWGGLQENFAGLEEFVQLTQYIGAEPLICIRWTGKTPKDAAHEIEYFNGAEDTEWGRKRAANGHPAPYQIKYWQIGNEVSGPDYDASVKAFAEAMRRVDPSIKILSSFPSEDTLRQAGGQLDYLCPHHYSVADLRGTEEDLQRLRNEITRDGAGKPVRVAVTEWNATGGEFGLKRGMLLTLGNALTLSRYQNLLHRYSDLVEIANRSNLADSFGSGAIQSGPGWLYFSPAYFSQWLYQRAAGSFSLELKRTGPQSFYLQEPDLEAALSADGKTLRIYAVNSTPDHRKVAFHLDPRWRFVSEGQEFVLGDSTSPADSEAMNSHDQPDRVGLVMRHSQIRGSSFRVDFLPFTVTLLELNLTSATRVSGQ
jgi:alpha-N-arabinofuranosidase